MSESAEAIASVIADVKKGRFNVVSPITDSETVDTTIDTVGLGPIIDVTPIFRSIVDRKEQIQPYEQVMAPPYPFFDMGWVNSWGQVTIMSVSSWDQRDEEAGAFTATWQPDSEDGHTIDWDEARWAIAAVAITGGWPHPESPTFPEGRMPTLIDPFTFLAAVNGDGSPQDFSWYRSKRIRLAVADTETQEEAWQAILDGSLRTFSAAMNFLNCRNVEAVEPRRSRHERRRIERALPGVVVKELVVRSLRRKGGTSGGTPGEAAPLHSVIGHFAEYGPRFGKGLLFGKHEGRYWVPAHARGVAEAGEVVKSYRLEES